MRLLRCSVFLLPALTLVGCQSASPTPTAVVVKLADLPAPAVFVVTATPLPLTSTPTGTPTSPPTPTLEPSPTATSHSPAEHSEVASPVPARLLPTAAPVALAIAPTATLPALPQDVTLEAAEQMVVDLSNAQRAAAGLGLLAVHPSLSAIARNRAADMATRGYFSHDDPATGEHAAQSLAVGAGFPGQVAENIYWSGKPLAQLPSAAVGWFMSDLPHAGNILKPGYDYVGVGIAPGANGTWILSQVFGTP